MTKIAIYTPIYPPDRGGASSYFSELVTSLSNEYEFVIVTSWNKNKSLNVDKNGSRVLRIMPRFHWLPRPIRAIFEPLATFLLILYLRVTNQIDILHAHSTSLGTVGIGIASTVARIPLIYDCRDVDFPKWLVHIGQTKYWFSAAENIDERLTSADVPQNRIMRIPVVNPDYVLDYRPKTLPSVSNAGLDVLFVGSIREAKGVKTLFDAFCGLLDSCPDATLTFIGEGPAKTALEDRTEAQRLTDQVRFAGELSHRSTLSRIAEADVLVLPSESEGLPRVILESLDLGTPVVSTRVGSIESVLDHKKNGLFIEKDEEEIQNVLKRLYENKEKLSEMTRNAWESGGEERWQSVVEDIDQIYRIFAKDTKK